MNRKLGIGLGLALLGVGLVACSTPSVEEPAQQTEANTQPTIEFSAASGVYSEAFDLTMTAAEGTTIYYTTDGSDPTSSETAKEYTAAITIADRSNDANVVSAVDPDLFCTNYTEYHKHVADCYINPPSDDAVDKCTVIRAVAKSSTGEFSTVEGATYFIGDMTEHIEGLKETCEAAGKSLAVISITMDYDDLFDPETGIYVRGTQFEEALQKYNGQDEIRYLAANYNSRGKDWERLAHIEFFETDPTQAESQFSQECGIRIQGNYSRSDLQKSFRFYAKDKYGKDHFNYAIWGEDNKDIDGDTIDEYKTFVVRAGGNCAFTSKYNDTFWQSLVAEGDYAISTKNSRPCVVYLNGEYWGLYVLEEDYNSDYMENHYKVDSDGVVIYKADAERYECGYKLDEGELPEGENLHYFFSDLKDMIYSTNELTKEEYDKLCTLVDVNSFMDYFAVEVWINNKWDWPGKNWSIWKTTELDSSNPYADGRWRLMLYDVEFGGVSGSSDATTNTMKEDNYKDLGLLDQGTNNVVVRTFALLMTYPEFKEAFCERLEGLSTDVFEQSRALERLELFENVYGPLFDQFFERYPESGNKKEALNGGYASSKCIRDFLTKRADYLPKMITWTKKHGVKIDE